MSILRDAAHRTAGLDTLRRRARAIVIAEAGHAVIPLGVAPFDRALAGGLGCGRVHEIAGERAGAGRDAAPSGFTVALASRILAETGSRGDILWCVRPSGGLLSARGLAWFGFDPARVVFMEAANDAERLWAMEEGLGCGDLAAVVAELGPARNGRRESIVCRRLRLAARTGGVTGFLLRAEPGHGATPDSRWQVSATPSRDMTPHWHVRLMHARNGRSCSGALAWDPDRREFRQPGYDSSGVDAGLAQVSG